MTLEEVLKLIRINKPTKRKAVILLSDFLDIDRHEAANIYRKYFEQSNQKE